MTPGPSIRMLAISAEPRSVGVNATFNFSLAFVFGFEKITGSIMKVYQNAPVEWKR
jgi:hypothetical protein